MTLPRVLYVYEEDDGDGDKYLMVSRSPLEQENEKEPVGIYDLREKIYVRRKSQVRRDNTKTWFDYKGK